MQHVCIWDNVNVTRVCLVSQVLQFSNETERRIFMETLQQALKNHGGCLEHDETKLKHMYKTAFTQKKRNQILERFFKTVFSEVTILI